MNKLKGYLVTGLLVFIPFWATAFIVYKTFGFLDGWTRHLGIRVPGVGLVTLLATLLVIGLITRNYIGHKAHQFSEWMMLKIPLVNRVYAVIKEVSKTLLNQDKSAFQEVVAVKFSGHWTIGFITGEVPREIKVGIGTGTIDFPTNPDNIYQMVYIMQAFSPAAGFIMMIPRQEIRKVDMTVEAAMKLVLTGGMVKEIK